MNGEITGPDKELLALIRDIAEIAKDAPDDLRAELIETIRLLNSPVMVYDFPLGTYADYSGKAVLD